MRPIYSLLFLALLPLILGRLYLKGRSLPAYRKRIPERFACYREPAPPKAPIWIHAVSVGECEAAFPLVRRLQKERPGIPILMTCTTPTGSSRVQSVLGNSVSHVYLPYDLPLIAHRFFAISGRASGSSWKPNSGPISLLQPIVWGSLW